VSSPHLNPEKNGHRFGDVVVTIDLELGDCILHTFSMGPVSPVPRQVRLMSLDEVQGAYMVQRGLVATDPFAQSNVAALKFAGLQLKNHQEARRR